MVWICAGSSVDNRETCLLSGAVVVEQCFPRAKAFAGSGTAPPAGWLGVPKELGGDTARTADPMDQRDIPFHMMSCSVYKGLGEGEEEERGGGSVWSGGVCLPKSP